MNILEMEGVIITDVRLGNPNARAGIVAWRDARCLESDAHPIGFKRLLLRTAMRAVRLF